MEADVEEQAAIWRVLGALVQDGARYAKAIAEQTPQLADLTHCVTRLERPKENRDD